MVKIGPTPIAIMTTFYIAPPNSGSPLACTRIFPFMLSKQGAIKGDGLEAITVSKVYLSLVTIPCSVQMTVQYRIETDEQGAYVIESDYISRAERISAGRSRRANTARNSHAGWKPQPDRRDPIEILEESNEGRVPYLIPIRYGRMLAGPFPFLRGSAALMAEDLASTATSGIRVQACGDCHLLNFGLFASPERNLFFGINDFDETLNAPFEWDVKRLAVSFMVASQANGYTSKEASSVVAFMARSYREYMADLATMRALDVWYTRLTGDMLLEKAPTKEARRYREVMLAKARKRVAEYVFPKLTATVNGRRRFVDQPPLIHHENWGQEQFENLLNLFDQYRQSLLHDRRVILDRYRMVDIAFKVVGIGSVGTRCYVVLLLAEDGDPLILQVKEARHSVLEPFAGAGPYEQQGRRVVEGQRLTQAASDIFLGWFTNKDGIDYYVRQLRDMKYAYDPTGVSPVRLANYAQFCGWNLARAHAKSGDAAEIAGYLGKSDSFDQAIVSFAREYAAQNRRDYEMFSEAVREKRIAATTGL
jgi:uncharacterized protein (DUF2252 family)